LAGRKGPLKAPPFLLKVRHHRFGCKAWLHVQGTLDIRRQA